MSIDPDTGQSVLLMELMDESLTHFLETSANPIPYGVLINICLDVARALSFLHSDTIIHRDLSSNNILLEGTYTAKLTDSGLAKFSNIRMPNVSNTKCPGTQVYMPPEACRTPVVYTTRGDVFSFGVNMIQMLTRRSPDPGNSHKPFVNTVPNSNPTLLSGTIEVRVPEVERRDNHIKEISSAHPLLPVALDCLKDQEEDRPSAGQVYLQLSALKNTPGYIMSEVARHIQQPSVPRQVRSQRSEARDHVKVKRDVKSLNWKIGEDAPSVMKRDELFSSIVGRHKWTKVFPPMLTERHNVAAVSTDTALIVAGREIYGYIRDKTTNIEH